MLPGRMHATPGQLFPVMGGIFVAAYCFQYYLINFNPFGNVKPRTFTPEWKKVRNFILRI